MINNMFTLFYFIFSFVLNHISATNLQKNDYAAIAHSKCKFLRIIIITPFPANSWKSVSEAVTNRQILCSKVYPTLFDGNRAQEYGGFSQFAASLFVGEQF